MNEKYEAILARREQAQHTPGPWHTGRTEAGRQAVYNHEARAVVADCSYDTDIPVDERIANAALIARAPELAAENERLRALVIATATGIREVADLLAPTAPATAASLRHRADAAIEAAKEATHAK